MGDAKNLKAFNLLVQSAASQEPFLMIIKLHGEILIKDNIE
jgi:hypothetical protein